MALSKETKRILYYSDLLIANFWRYLLKALWLFFPPILFLLLAYASFWHILQGRDLMVIALQNESRMAPYVFACFILALIFWVYVTWYSTRLVAKARDFQEPNPHHIWEAFLEQSPRILAFSCITIILLGFFQTAAPMYPQVSSLCCHILFLLSFPWYFIIYKSWTNFLQQKGMTKENWMKFLENVRIITYTVLISWIICVVIMKSFWALISLLIVLQVGLVLLLILRREIVEARNNAAPARNPNPHHITPRSRIWKKVRHIVTDDEDKMYFKGFNVITALALVIYIGAIASVKFSVFLGSFPFLLLAFGVLLGIGNFITMISVFGRFNFHVLFFLLAALIGHFIDPHYATVVKKRDTSISFKDRKDLKQYFIDWINDSTRKKTIDTSAQYPVYFVLANGGASRSGYWTSSILSGMEELTNGKFSDHLFCLSGASGGSVGTSTFFSLLRAKDRLKEKNIPITRAATDFLSSDFLTYTLAHLLGPDIIRNTIPLWFINDRAAALAHAIEKAPGEKNFLYDSFAVRFTQIMTNKNQKEYKLPILCINTTRMQDGRPGVISNIRLEDKYFNSRIDVLSLLREDMDMKLSTAVVLGASFPYVSPAGRINNKACRKCPGESHYFVDGGYFDNSGAGVVNEMMIALANMMDKDTALQQYRKKLQFYVIHITNTDKKVLHTGQINPMTNDLLAPVKTMMGSYGIQTTINDQRLKNFLWNLYDDSTHYTNIELYPDKSNLKYSMNWVISRYQLDSMNYTLFRNPAFLGTIEKIKK